MNTAVKVRTFDTFWRIELTFVFAKAAGFFDADRTIFFYELGMA